MGYGIEGYADWSYDIIIAGVDNALRLMKTDYIDIVHLHSCDLNTLQRGEAIEAPVSYTHLTLPTSDLV